MRSFMQAKSYQGFIPFFFVALYGSGFVGTKYGLEHANPLSFLLSRFAAASIILAVLAFLLMKINSNTKQEMHNLKETMHIAIAGLLSVATLSVGVFVSIDMGLSPSLSAMIIALQPILVGLLAIKLINEKVTLKQWFGLTLGVVGVFFVLMRNVTFDQVGLGAVGMSILALLGLTLGNIYQKQYCSDMNLFYGGAIQSGVSAIACLVLLLLFSDFQINWTIEYIYAWSYMTIGVSVGALSLLYVMIHHGSVTKVASLFYLVPVFAAIMSFFFYAERLNPMTLFGIGTVIIAIILTVKSK